MSDLNVALVLRLKDEASKALGGVAGKMGDLAKAAAPLSRESAKALRQTEAVAKAVRSCGAAWERHGKAGNAALKSLGASARGLGSHCAAVATGVAALGASAAKAGSEAARGLGASAAAADGFGRSVEGARGRLNALLGDAQKLKGLRRDFQNLAAAGGAVMGAGAAVMAPMGAAVAKAAQAEARRVAIERPFIGADGRSKLDAHRGAAIAAASAAGMGEAEGLDMLAGALARRVAAGMAKDQDLSQALDASAKLSVVHGVSGREAAELLTGVAVGYKVSGGEEFDLANYLSNAAHSAGMSIQSMAGIVAGLDNRAGNLGIDGLKGAKSVALMATAFKGAGMGDEEAGGAIDTLLRTAPMLGFRQLHGDGAMAQMVKSAVGGGDRLRAITAGIFGADGRLVGKDGADRMLTVVELFDRLSKSIENEGERVRVFTALLPGAKNVAGLAANVDAWDRAAAAINDHAGLMRDYADVTGTTAFKWELLKARVLQTAAAIGKELKPTIDPLLDRAARVIARIKDWTAAHPTLTKGVLLTAGAAGALLVGLGAVVAGVGLLGAAVTGTFSAFATWKGHIDGAMKWLGALGNRAVATAAKMEAVNAVTGNTGSFKLGKAGNATAKAVTAAPTPGVSNLTKAAKVAKVAKVAQATRAVNALKVAGTVATTAMPLAAGAGGTAAAGAATGMISGIGAALASIPVIGWAILAVLVAVAAAVYKYWNPIKAFFQGVWDGLREGWETWAKPALDGLCGALGGLWDQLKGLMGIFIPVQSGMEGVEGAFSAGAVVGEALAGVFATIVHTLTAVGVAIETVVFGVRTVVDTVVTLVKSVYHALAAVNAAKSGRFLEAKDHMAAAGKAWGDYKDRTANAARATSIGRYFTNESGAEGWDRVGAAVSRRKPAEGPLRVTAPGVELDGKGNVIRTGADGVSRVVRREDALRAGLVARTEAAPDFVGPMPVASAALASGVRSGAPDASGVRSGAPDAVPPERQAKRAEGPEGAKAAGRAGATGSAPVTTIDYRPTVNIAGSATADDEGRFRDLLQKHREGIAKMVNEVNARNARWVPA